MFGTVRFCPRRRPRDVSL